MNVVIYSCDYLLYQHITEPTRYRLGTEPHILDLVLMNEEQMVDNVTYLHGLGKSDHICIVFNMACCTEKQYKCFKSFNFKEANFDRLIHKLESNDWDQILEPLDANLGKFYSYLN